jgi:hypothetical protein
MSHRGSILPVVTPQGKFGIGELKKTQNNLAVTNILTTFAIISPIRVFLLFKIHKI